MPAWAVSGTFELGLEIATRMRSDTQLMAAVADSRDRQAFEELYRRYQKPAYRLARYLLHDQEAAEEAVQVAMIQVWKYAPSFKPGKSVRSWLMSIVANKCFGVIRGVAKKTKRETNLESEFERASKNEVEPTESMENAESIAGLRHALDALPQADRKIMALHYGAGLSQHEVAQTLSMPQTTVSLKIRTILELLRTRLTRVGLASAVSLLTAERLAEVICSGSVPEGLGERLASSLECADLWVEPGGGEASASTGSVTSGLSGNLFLLMGAVVAVVVVGGGLLWSQPTSENEAVLSGAALGGLENSNEATPLNIRWDFAQGLPAEFLTIGSLEAKKLAPENDQAGGMLFRRATYLVPLAMRKKPHVLESRIRFSDPKDPNLALYGAYSDREQALPRLVWDNKDLHRAEIKKAHLLKYYFIGKWSIVVMNEKTIISVAEYESPYPGSFLCLSLDKIIVFEMTLKELDENEIPNFLKAPQSLIKQMARGPKKVPGGPYPNLRDRTRR